MGFQRELEKVTEEQRERKKKSWGERETTQINEVITCHAHNRNIWPRSGKDKKESSVLRVKTLGDKLLRLLMMSPVLSLFPDSGW